MTKSGALDSTLTSGLDRLGGVRSVVVAFVCENCGRPGMAPSSGLRRRPSLPDFQWPLPVQEVAIPCAGRLQPEHLMKALEDGADAVGVVCCAEGNCHHGEGNRRCRRRLDYVADIVDQAGLGRDRLGIFHLPGSAAEDMALGVGVATRADPAMAEKIRAVRVAFTAWITKLPRNPLAQGELPEESPYEVNSDDEGDE